MARETNRDKTAASAKASWRPFEADHSPVRSDVFYKERDAGAASPALEARRRPLAPSGRALSLRAHPGDGRGRGDRAVRRDRGGPLRDRDPLRAAVAVPWRRSFLVFVRNRARGMGPLLSRQPRRGALAPGVRRHGRAGARGGGGVAGGGRETAAALRDPPAARGSRRGRPGFRAL